ncbi:MAG: hypothetical protein JKY98_08995 [Gammaproteobacteria bacterium]|nr:hypothetical protein [Gammaproteobacteria bacterium]
MLNRRTATTLLTSLYCLLLASCVASPPESIANVCDIFEDRRPWYKAVKNTEQRWGVPVPVTMAFIYQESGFRARAKPKRKKVLWIFPGSRPSSAFGYAQAVDTTWEDYKRATGNWSASRSDFKDAADFIGWYNAMSNKANNIAPTDAANLYFAYHEGNAGYSRGSYREKPWLLDAANAVQANADRFNSQYAGCKVDLNKSWLFRLFS